MIKNALRRSFLGVIITSDIFEKKINGIVYRAQFKGIAFAQNLEEKILKENSRLQVAEILFSEILISPKIGIDDFVDLSSFNKVYEFLLNVARGLPEKKPSDSALRKKVRDEWSLWRLVLSQRGFDYQTVFGKSCMNFQDVAEANIALDMQITAEKKAAKRKS